MKQSRQVADAAPNRPFLTGYDMDHLVDISSVARCLRRGNRLREVARIVLNLDKKDPDRPKRVWQSHLTRATLLALSRAGSDYEP